MYIYINILTNLIKYKKMIYVWICRIWLLFRIEESIMPANNSLSSPAYPFPSQLGTQEDAPALLPRSKQGSAFSSHTFLVTVTTAKPDGRGTALCGKQAGPCLGAESRAVTKLSYVLRILLTWPFPNTFSYPWKPKSVLYIKSRCRSSVDVDGSTLITLESVYFCFLLLWLVIA